MSQSLLEKFGAHQKARQLFDLVVPDMQILLSRHSTLDPRHSLPETGNLNTRICHSSHVTCHCLYCR